MGTGSLTLGKSFKLFGPVVTFATHSVVRYVIVQDHGYIYDA